MLNELPGQKIKYFSDLIGEVDTVDKPQTEVLDELFRGALREAWI